MRTHSRVNASPSLLVRVSDGYSWCLDTFGKVPTLVGSALLVLAIFGGLRSAGAEDRSDMISSIPDGISAECHAKLLRSYYGESSADRYEQALAASDNSGAAVTPDNCGDIGTVQ